MELESWLESLHYYRHTEPGTRVSFDKWFLGRYEIERYLGHGSSALAFLATDTVIERSVVLKICSGYQRVPSTVFLKEARTIARIKHANLLEVYDFGESPVPWMALEYLGTTTIRTVLRKNSSGLGWTAKTADIILQVASLLEYLHASVSVFQFDLKPDNLAYIPKRTSYG